MLYFCLTYNKKHTPYSWTHGKLPFRGKTHNAIHQKIESELTKRNLTNATYKLEQISLEDYIGILFYDSAEVMGLPEGMDGAYVEIDEDVIEMMIEIVREDTCD